MAIFGDFSDLPFLEVMRVLRERQGRLVVYSETGKVCGIFIHHRALIDLWFGETQVQSKIEVQRFLQQLNCLNEGSFEFFKLASPPQSVILDIPLEGLEVWLAADSKVENPQERDAQEIQRLQDAFPHPETRLILTNPISANLSQVSYEALEVFYQKLGSEKNQVGQALKRGISAEMLAQWLEWPIKRCQLELYRLQEVAVLETLRVFSQPTAQSQIQTKTAERSQRKTGLLARLLGVLGFNG